MMQIMSEMGVLDRHYRGVERISGEKSPSIQDGGFVLYKFLPIPCIIQPEYDEEDRGDQHIHPAMEDRVEKYLRIFINGDIVRIQEDIPLAVPDSPLYHGE